VASIWLLLGNTGAVIARNRNGAAASLFVPPVPIFRPESEWFPAMLWSTLQEARFKAR
jgi:hypothetical protein